MKPPAPVALDTDKMEKLRKSLGLSMEDAAQAAGLMSRQRWFAIVSGVNTNITLDTLNAIAHALGKRDRIVKARLTAVDEDKLVVGPVHLHDRDGRVHVVAVSGSGISGATSGPCGEIVETACL